MIKFKWAVSLVLVIIVFSAFYVPVFAAEEITGLAVSLPEAGQVPSIISKTAQKDKAAIVLISSIVSGTAIIPSFTIELGAGSLVGTWESTYETVTFTEDGQFTVRGYYTDGTTYLFSGTYTIQGDYIAFNYVDVGVVEQPFSISGDILTLSYTNEAGQLISVEYEKAGGTATSDDASILENLMFVREEGQMRRF